MLKRLRDIVRSHYNAAVLPKESAALRFDARAHAAFQGWQEPQGWQEAAETRRQAERAADEAVYPSEQVKGREAVYLANLELAPGASFVEIKAQYKRLLKKYHPDLYQSQPGKLALALEVSTKLNEAYRYFREKYQDSTSHKT